MLWWYWAIIGLGCILLELLIPAFVLVWFGLGGLLVMVLMLIIDIPVPFQILLWTGLSLVMVGLWFKIFKTKHHKSLIGRGSAQLVGEVGLLIESVAPFKQGQVQFQKPILGSDKWVCIADESITAGTRVKIVSVEGSMLKITKVGE